MKNHFLYFSKQSFAIPALEPLQRSFYRMRKTKAAIFLFLVLVCSNALACDSFEDCMKKSESIDWEQLSITEASVLETSYHSKAIAYKLDEISKQNRLIGRQVIGDHQKMEYIRKRLNARFDDF
jgi:hypothetical protein